MIPEDEEDDLLVLGLTVLVKKKKEITDEEDDLLVLG